MGRSEILSPEFEAKFQAASQANGLEAYQDDKYYYAYLEFLKIAETVSHSIGIGQPVEASFRTASRDFVRGTKIFDRKKAKGTGSPRDLRGRELLLRP